MKTITRVVVCENNRIRMFLESLDLTGKHRNLAGQWPAPQGAGQCRAALYKEITAWLNDGGPRVEQGQLLSVQIGPDTGGW